METQQSEVERLQESADFWRARSNAFEIALRQIAAVTGTDSEEVASERWEIAKRAIEDRGRENLAGLTG